MSEAMSLRIEAAAPGHSEVLSQTMAFGGVLRIGRSPQFGWKIPWDQMISREHADLRWDGEKLHVQCLPNVANPLRMGDGTFYELRVWPGQSFKIGMTRFSVEFSLGGTSKRASSKQTATPPSVPEVVTSDEHILEQSFSLEELNRVAFRNPEQQMEFLTHLPGIITNSQTDEELAVSLTGLLVEAIPLCDCVAVVRYREPDLNLNPSDTAPESLPEPVRLHEKTREGFEGSFRPSRRLILKALEGCQSVMHMWRGDALMEQFTMTRGLDWAFATPIRGEPSRGWCLYVAGQRIGTRAGETALKGDLRFTELVAQFIGSVRQVRVLQEQRTKLSAFLSPSVVENITGRNVANDLEPAERDVSILFCDIRGFSRKAEALSHDLGKLLKSASAALGVMSRGILDHEGTIADFQGDAALGFWGWPVATADGPIPACRAALEIHRHFRDAEGDETSLLQGFSVGIGITHGRAIAGSIGTEEQAKVGVFGPIVNQGSRLEGLNRQFGTRICLDETTANWVRRLIPSTEGRLRRLARVRPHGMDAVLTVFELLPPLAEQGAITAQMIEDLDEAVGLVIDGRWSEALEVLDELPEDDGPVKFLRQQMGAFGNQPPEEWDGAFQLVSR